MKRSNFRSLQYPRYPRVLRLYPPSHEFTPPWRLLSPPQQQMLQLGSPCMPGQLRPSAAVTFYEVDVTY